MLAQTVIASLFATAALARPAPSTTTSNSLMFSMPEEKPLPIAADSKEEKWTTKNLSRTCNTGDTECVWDFSVDTHTPGSETPYHCVYKVEGDPASKTDGVPTQCKVFRIATGYDANGKFTVLTVVHEPSDRMIYAGFDDSLLTNGTVVPDKDWKVEPIPKAEA